MKSTKVFAFIGNALALGVQLFDGVEGNHFTILGMPLLAVLGALRTQGELAA